MSIFDNENVVNVITKKRKNIDRIIINPRAESIEITIVTEYLNNDNEIIMTENNNNYIYTNYTDKDNKEINNFNIFCSKIGLTLQKIKSAILEM